MLLVWEQVMKGSHVNMNHIDGDINYWSLKIINKSTHFQIKTQFTN